MLFFSSCDAILRDAIACTEWFLCCFWIFIYHVNLCFSVLYVPFSFVLKKISVHCCSSCEFRCGCVWVFKPRLSCVSLGHTAAMMDNLTIADQQVVRLRLTSACAFVPALPADVCAVIGTRGGARWHNTTSMMSCMGRSLYPLFMFVCGHWNQQDIIKKMSDTDWRWAEQLLGFFFFSEKGCVCVNHMPNSAQDEW